MTTHRLGKKAFSLAILTIFGAMSSVWAQTTQKQGDPFAYHRDDLMGTSLDLKLVASSQTEADAGAKVIFDEIERLNAILSTYNDKSEISQINHTKQPVKVSPELLQVLTSYLEFQKKSSGALSVQMGGLVDLWTKAGKAGKLPSSEEIDTLVKAAQGEAFKLDKEASTVTRITDQPLNINSIGKGYVIGKAVEKLKARMPDIRGVMLSIGGDILVHGTAGFTPDKKTWAIDVANPKQAAENARPLTKVILQNKAVATSGTYERFEQIQGKKYSHIIDPRTGQPVSAIASATVIAPDNVTANALATTCCILPPEESLKLVKATPGVEALLVLADGKEIRSTGFQNYEKPSNSQNNNASPAWPNGNQFTIKFTVDPNTNPQRTNLRPYVAIWVEDEQGKFIRTIELWANAKKPKYLHDILSWWIVAGKKMKTPAQAITRATRPAGQYSVTWDGNDSNGKALVPGKFKVVLEVSYEDGVDRKSSAIIDCTKKKTEVRLENAENFHDAVITYGPVEK